MTHKEILQSIQVASSVLRGHLGTRNTDTPEGKILEVTHVLGALAGKIEATIRAEPEPEHSEAPTFSAAGLPPTIKGKNNS